MNLKDLSIFFTFYALTCYSIFSAADTAVSGIIAENQIWTQTGSPYRVVGDTTVGALVTVTIEPGVTVEFTGPYWLRIQGSLDAQGTESNRIVFSSDGQDSYWHHIEFLNSLNDSTLSYVTINQAGVNHGNGSQAYGAIYLVDSYPMLNNLEISGNLVTGIYAIDIADVLSITNSSIVNNTNNALAGIGAGGIYIQGTIGGSATIENSVISNNRGDTHGGGIYIANLDAVRINNNEIRNNAALGLLGNGGGIYLSSLYGTVSENIINNNTILNNIADQNGGAIWLDESAVSVTGNDITNNVAYDSKGGGIYIGDTDTQDSIFSASIIRNNKIFTNNAAELGGGIYIENGDHYINSNIIYGNSADDAGGSINNEQGGGLIIRDGTVDFSKNVVAGNYAAAIGGALSVGASGNIYNNSIVQNESRQVLRFSNNVTVHGNTIVANVSEMSIVVVPSQANVLPTINNNNIFSNGFAYAIQNTNALTLNAESNWWGSADTLAIEFDLDGDINYSNYVAQPLEDTPLSPPQIVEFTYTAESAVISWNSNTELDLSGYKVHWGRDPAPNFTNVADLGLSTSFTFDDNSLSGVYIAITAYDSGIGNDIESTVVNEDQINGNESWFSEQQYWPDQSTTQTNSNNNAGNNVADSGGGGGIGGHFLFFLLYFVVSTRFKIRHNVLNN